MVPALAQQRPDREAKVTWACPGSRKRAYNIPAHRDDLSRHSRGLGYKEQEIFVGVQVELDHLDNGVLTGPFQRGTDFQFLR